MRFPLAAFCASFFIAMLAAALLPAAVLYAAAGLLGVAFAAVSLVRRRGRAWPPGVPYMSLVLAGFLLALVWRGGYIRLLQPAGTQLAGSAAVVEVLVMSTEPGYGEDTVRAVLRLPQGFDVDVQNLPYVEVGQRLRLPLRFYDFSTTASRSIAYAKGRWVRASLDGEVEILGRAHTFTTWLRGLQYAATENIRSRLPQRLSNVAAAMSVGDKRYLSYEVTEEYRAAGLSHLLVVSGMHLSLLAGSMAKPLSRLLSRRKAALAGLAFVAAFTVFAGLSPSILRSGFMWGMIFMGDFLKRKAHAPTSLALSLCLMTMQNPWAAADVGLLLSVAATMGLLLSGKVTKELRDRFILTDGRYEAAKWVVLAAIPSLYAAVFTLPVLVAAQMGVSLLSLPANVIALPLMPLIVAGGFLMALPPGIPVLEWIVATAALIAGVMLRILELVCRLCAAIPWAYVPLGGGFALCVVLVVYGLVVLGIKTRRLRAFCSAAAGMLALALVLGGLLSAGTVRVVTAGAGNPSLVVIKDGQAVVLYRSRLSANAVAGILRQYRVEACVLLVDLRQTTQSMNHLDAIQPLQVVMPNEELVAGGAYTPMDGVSVTVVRQSGGTAACVDISGYKVGCYTGSVDFSPYAKLDVLLAGSGRAAGEYGALLSGASVPDWADGGAPVIKSDGQATLWLRPGKSVIFREVLDG